MSVAEPRYSQQAHVRATVLCECSITCPHCGVTLTLHGSGDDRRAEMEDTAREWLGDHLSGCADGWRP